MKKKVLILFGGPSMEYYAACKAYAGFIDYVDRDLFDVVQIGITPEGEWLLTDATSEDIFDGEAWMKKEGNKKAIITPIKDEHCIYVFDGDKYYTEHVDVAFPYVVGYGGEDGRIPGLLDLANIPYVGSGVAASACSIDKELTRLFADACNLKQPECSIISKDEYYNGEFDKEALLSFGYPVFVKPANGGTSVGVSRATNDEEFKAAMDESFKWDDKTLIEQEIKGSEIKVAVLGNENVEIGALCEITTPEGMINDYETKQTKSSKKDIPANLPKEVEEEIKRQAVEVYKKLNCRSFARVDFFLNDKKEIFFNEINTIPGLGKSSIYSQMFEAAGVEFKELLTKLILTADN